MRPLTGVALASCATWLAASLPWPTARVADARCETGLPAARAATKASRRVALVLRGEAFRDGPQQWTATSCALGAAQTQEFISLSPEAAWKS